MDVKGDIYEIVENQKKDIEFVIDRLKKCSVGEDQTIIQQYQGMVKGFDWILAQKNIVIQNKMFNEVDFEELICVVCKNWEEYETISELWESHGAINNVEVVNYMFCNGGFGLIVSSDFNIELIEDVKELKEKSIFTILSCDSYINGEK